MPNYCPNCGEQNPAAICVCGQVTNASPLGFAISTIHKEVSKPVEDLETRELLCIIETVKTITSEVVDFNRQG
jgi:hypothetical protein